MHETTNTTDNSPTHRISHNVRRSNLNEDWIVTSTAADDLDNTMSMGGVDAGYTVLYMY